MKKLTLLLLTFLIVLSCSKEQTIDNNKPQTSNESKMQVSDIFNEGLIGYFDSDSSFVTIDVTEFESFLNHFYDFDDIIFDFHELRQTEGDDGQIYYYVYSNSATSNYATHVVYQDNYSAYAILQNITCTCTSTDSRYAFDCNASITNGNCECSSCDNTCTKSSTATSEGFW